MSLVVNVLGKFKCIQFYGRKFAFTLAEVLITLGIIGVVAAMTMPTLINNSRHKQLEAQFKKAYSIIAQVTQKINMEEYGGAGLPMNPSGRDWTNLINAYKKHLKIKSEDRIFYQEIRQIYKSFSNGGYSGIGNDGNFDTLEMTGMSLFFDSSNPGEFFYGVIIIAVDVNGWWKGPNKVGYDMFWFQVDERGRLMPMGAPGTRIEDHSVYCSPTSNNGYNGATCAAKAITDKDYFKNLQ